jgi:hypothetical protein
MKQPGSVHAFVDLQPRHFVFQLQLAPLEFRQSEIVRGGMLEGLGELVFEHPMPLCKFCKIRRCSHVSSWSDFEPDSISLTRGKKGVDIRKVVRRSNAVDLAEQILLFQAESAGDLEMSQAFATTVRRRDEPRGGIRGILILAARPGFRGRALLDGGRGRGRRGPRIWQRQ